MGSIPARRTKRGLVVDSNQVSIGDMVHSLNDYRHSINIVSGISFFHNALGAKYMPCVRCSYMAYMLFVKVSTFTNHAVMDQYG